jgi:LPXTG-motif cell wall-anchored protein
VHQSIPGTFVSGAASIGFTATNPAVKGITPATVPGIANFGCTAPTSPPASAPASTEASGGQAPANLADTGSPTLTYAGIAGLLIAAGIGLLLLGRRRRRTS